jgi:hypothetical protein
MTFHVVFNEILNPLQGTFDVALLRFNLHLLEYHISKYGNTVYPHIRHACRNVPNSIYLFCFFVNICWGPISIHSIIKIWLLRLTPKRTSSIRNFPPTFIPFTVDITKFLGKETDGPNFVNII